MYEKKIIALLLVSFACISICVVRLLEEAGGSDPVGRHLRNTVRGSPHLRAPVKTEVPDFTAVYEVPGNSVSKKVTVEVAFKDNAIQSIKVVDHGETQRILDTVIERLIPRIIEAQSLAVDSITGTTNSSSANK